jgi:hypothetical protein
MVLSKFAARVCVRTGAWLCPTVRYLFDFGRAQCHLHDIVLDSNMFS